MVSAVGVAFGANFSLTRLGVALVTPAFSREQGEILESAACILKLEETLRSKDACSEE